jgi:predicted nucleotidyltransferase
VVDPNIQKITEYLKSEFCPTRIFLFGSRAQGTAGENSDYDFVVVTEKPTDSKWVDYDKARNFILQHFGVRADVWVYSQSTFEEWKNEFGSIPETALNTGVEL